MINPLHSGTLHFHNCILVLVCIFILYDHSPTFQLNSKSVVTIRNIERYSLTSKKKVMKKDTGNNLCNFRINQTVVF